MMDETEALISRAELVRMEAERLAVEARAVRRELASTIHRRWELLSEFQALAQDATRRKY